MQDSPNRLLQRQQLMPVSIEVDLGENEQVKSGFLTPRIAYPITRHHQESFVYHIFDNPPVEVDLPSLQLSSIALLLWY